MKKIICLLLAVLTAASCIVLSSCELIDGAQMEIAMVTDGGSVENSSLNQAVWSSVVNFAIAKNKTCEAYHPESQTEEDRVDCIMKAVVNGARVVVCSGSELESSVFKVEDLFPDVNFILVDGEPRGIIQERHFVASITGDASETTDVSETTDNSPQIKISSNVHCITFSEEQAGYLAGYVAVRDGYTKFGFISAKDSVSDMLYGSGFLQGINTAAVEMGIVDFISVNFRYNNSDLVNNDIIQNVAKNWYIGGTELIFASGITCEPVIAAAEETNGRVICTDSDHALASNLVVTSAVKMVNDPITNALNSLYDNGLDWDDAHAGKTAHLGVAENGVGLPTELSSWRFGNFTVDAYQMVVADIVSGEIKISSGQEIFEEHDIDIEFVT